MVATRKPTEEDLAGCRELGKKLAKLEKIEKSTKVEEPRL
jgi:hypothetical protein